jgi:uncharacterized protein DUF6988
MLSIESMILRADGLNKALEKLLVEKSYTVRNNRDGFCLLYWSLAFEIHRGILVLLYHKLPGPAYALMRPIVEAFLRLFLVIHGTDAQLAAIKNGTYSTDFTSIGEQIDEMAEIEPFLGPFFKKNTKVLHGFTHGGPEQLHRRSKGGDIIANYPDDEVRDVINFATTFAYLTSVHVSNYLGLDAELKAAVKIYDDYRRAESDSSVGAPTTE